MVQFLILNNFLTTIYPPPQHIKPYIHSSQLFQPHTTRITPLSITNPQGILRLHHTPDVLWLLFYFLFVLYFCDSQHAHTITHLFFQKTMKKQCLGFEM